MDLAVAVRRVVGAEHRNHAADVDARGVERHEHHRVLVVAVGLMPRLIADPVLQLAAAKACAIMASFLVNFSLSYFVVFRRKKV